MILWTIQPIEVYDLIQKTGVYRCDLEKSEFSECKEQYDWLVREMIEKTGEPPDGVSYPVWAWYMWEGTRKKPDLRRERWGNGWKGDQFVCMEIEIPDSKLVLSDFDSWSIILLNGFLADTEEEEKILETEYEAMPPEAQREYKYQNWRNVFDLTYVDNDWVHRGDSIQATFWELRKENIRKVWFFTSAAEKPENLEES